MPLQQQAVLRYPSTFSKTHSVAKPALPVFSMKFSLLIPKWRFIRFKKI
jgi:hypothetical protein